MYELWPAVMSSCSAVFCAFAAFLIVKNEGWTFNAKVVASFVLLNLAFVVMNIFDHVTGSTSL